MPKVRDIMTVQVVTLSDRASVDNAAWSLAARGISGAPVCDADGKLVGILSTSDLIDSIHHDGMSGDTSVSEAMTAAVWAVHVDAHAGEAVRLMVEKDVHRVLAMDSDGKVQGIVTTMDVARAIVRGLDLRPPSREPHAQSHDKQGS